MNKEQTEARIQEIRAILVADEARPHGEARQALIEELDALETSLS